MKSTIFILMILLSFKPAKSQVTFQKTFETNNDLKGRAIQQTTEEDIIAGEYGIFDAKIYVSKIDSIGNLQWAKTYMEAIIVMLQSVLLNKHLTGLHY
ncbi:MAG: hypothetical protein IPH33_15465 [Bacteroidetes bacterium]|nr:hypothetical protein [Bacteroidota bacterium]